MNVEPVNEWDAAWEYVADSYRVYFWTLLQEARDARYAPLWECFTQRLVEARDIDEVMSWARANADGRQFTVYVETASQPPGLLCVYGEDPTVAPPQIRADFQNSDPAGRIRLNTVAAQADLEREGPGLKAGLRVKLRDAELWADGELAWSSEEDLWVAIVDWEKIVRSAE